MRFNDQIQYIIHYLERKKGIAAQPLTADERIQLEELRKKVQNLTEDIEELKNFPKVEGEGEGEEEEVQGEEVEGEGNEEEGEGD